MVFLPDNGSSNNIKFERQLVRLEKGLKKLEQLIPLVERLEKDYPPINRKRKFSGQMDCDNEIQNDN
ncbi:hypothetical protein BX616_000115, partial [Lobosporangium transversale]